MSRAEVPVLAVVVVTRAGRALARALDSVAWAAERGVLDPAGEVGSETVPAGVRLARDATQVVGLGTAPWMLLLAEHEVAAAGLRRTSRASRGRVFPEPAASAWRWTRSACVWCPDTRRCGSRRATLLASSSSAASN